MCSVLFILFKASDFWDAISTGPSLKLLSDILLLTLVMEVLWLWAKIVQDQSFHMREQVINGIEAG